MNAGMYLDFYLPFKKDNGAGISAEDQAKTILQTSQQLLQAGSPGVAITYSANYGQTRQIAETYQQGGWYTGTNGANQAAVMHAMETLLGNAPYQALQGKLRIAPITTMNAYPGDGPAAPWNDRVHLAIVQTDLARIKAYLDDGWAVLGWQNQDSVKRSGQRYAVGGGVATLPAAVSNEIQTSLTQYAMDYPKK